MFAYVVGTDSEVGRCKAVSQAFIDAGLEFEAIPAVVEAESVPFKLEADGLRFALSRTAIPERESIASALGHVRAWQSFLASEREFAVVCEQGFIPTRKIVQILDEAVIYRDVWDILRLSGLTKERSRRVAHLRDGYWLSVNFGRLQGTGAYFVNRYAASVLVKELRPMSVPFEQALDREWIFGLNAASVTPNPFRTEASALVGHSSRKQSLRRSFWATSLFAALHDIDRFIARRRQLRRARSNYPAMKS